MDLSSAVAQKPHPAADQVAVVVAEEPEAAVVAVVVDPGKFGIGSQKKDGGRTLQGVEWKEK